MMWVFFSDAFVAISKHAKLPDHFMLHARLRGDIEAAFPGMKLQVSENAGDTDQYRFSAAISATDLIVAMNDRIDSLARETPREDIPLGHRNAAYTNVWFAMRAAQAREITQEPWREKCNQANQYPIDKDRCRAAP